jgi:hypothetical protein
MLGAGVQKPFPLPFFDLEPLDLEDPLELVRKHSVGMNFLSNKSSSNPIQTPPLLVTKGGHSTVGSAVCSGGPDVVGVV